MNIELTDWQVGPMGPILEKLKADDIHGKPGAVVAQIFLTDTIDGGAVMTVGYIDHERVLKIQEILGGNVGEIKKTEIYADILCPY